ncbi:ShET2/EspL2 family type III secretion system effector toxin, partial [Candidatus Ichthyocystis hellenicum]|uniref:ShET2/EspL2 family type III secretion system effector toxin n=1 Tax=Candidatus Ichthyocystis hellenicum TaxID=1561003 RepID=UPI0011125D6C
NAECRYVVHFFDPNKTNVVARSEVDNPDLFLNEEKFSLNKFTGSYYSVYFEKLLSAPKEHELMVYECSSNNIIGSESLLVFETLIHDGISECALYHLMENGICTKNIMMMSERLSLLPSSVRESIVYGRSSLGIQALHVALTNNRHNSIHAYCYLLRGLSDNEKLRVLPNLLTANNMRGESGLFMAMQEGSADAISAFGSLLDMLLSLKWKMSPNVLANTIFNLIEARRREGRRDTGLFMAMQGGRSSAVFAFRRLLDRLISLSGAVSVNSIAKMIFYILMSVNNRGVSGLFIAMQEGHSSSIYSFGSLLDRLVFVGNNIPKYSLDDMVFDILLARSGSVSNGLFSAIKNSRLGAIRAYCSLLSRISKHRWVDLLEAKNNYGMPGILLANGKTINFYLDVLSGFTIDVLSKLHYRLGNIRYTRKYIEYANSRNGLETARYENFLLGLEKIIRSKAALPTLPHKF